MCCMAITCTIHKEYLFSKRNISILVNMLNKKILTFKNSTGRAMNAKSPNEICIFDFELIL